MDKLPITQDHPCICDANDWWYDDGLVSILMTIDDGVATLHDVIANDEDRRAGRTGAGRAAMTRLRPHFHEIIASGVGDPYQADTPNYADQAGFLFWRQMLREGLIDRISFIICGTEMTRDDLCRSVKTGLCVIEPDPADIIAQNVASP